MSMIGAAGMASTGAPPSATSGAPSGSGAPTGAPSGTTGASGGPISGGPSGTGTAPGAANGIPDMSVRGAPHAPAPAAPAAPIGPPAAGNGATSPACPFMHAPPVFTGTAAASGLNAIAALNNPAQATTVMLNRSKIVTTPTPFSRLIIPAIDTASPYRSRLNTTEPIVSGRRATPAAPHRVVSKWLRHDGVTTWRHCPITST